jgi:RNA polymerase sigma factor (sigma-70 family)
MQAVAAGGADGELFLAVRRGDPGAWDALVDRFAGRVWAVARAHRLSNADAEDVSQVTWLRLVTHIDTIRDPERVGAWLATTARHECLRLLRKAGREIPVDEEDEMEPVLPVDAPVDTRLLTDERDQVLRDALAQLSPQCQRLLRVLMADPEPSYLEVSAALGMAVGSIGPTRQRCLAHLRARLARISDHGSSSSG